MKSSIIIFISAVLMCSSLCGTENALGGACSISTGDYSGTVVKKRVKSMRELRYENLVPQKLDFSCGCAAMATLLKYFYGQDITEEEAVKDVLRYADEKLVAKRGFSMLDLKRYAERQGFISKAYLIKSVDQVRSIKIPTVVLIDVRGYSHFVVLKGVRNGRVHMADPSLGHRSVPVGKFSRMWNGIVLAVFGSRSEELAYGPPDKEMRVEKGRVWGIVDVPRINFINRSFEVKR